MGSGVSHTPSEEMGVCDTHIQKNIECLESWIFAFVGVFHQQIGRQLVGENTNKGRKGEKKPLKRYIFT